MTHREWYEALADALQQENMPYTVMQLATIDSSLRLPLPRVRSLVHREFLTPASMPQLPLILTSTDIRTPKVSQSEHDRHVEVVYWLPRTQKQFRILGQMSIVPAPGYQRPYPAPTGLGYKALCDEGFDWEAKRVEMFDQMSPRLKAGWCRPPPGTPLDGEEEMRKWPQRLPKLGEAETEEDEKNLKVALSNFALVFVEPSAVDYVELGGEMDRRTQYAMWYTDEGGIEWRSTLVVP